jgi:hypothetical protein
VAPNDCSYTTPSRRSVLYCRCAAARDGVPALLPLAAIGDIGRGPPPPAVLATPLITLLPPMLMRAELRCEMSGAPAVRAVGGGDVAAVFSVLLLVCRR